MTTFVSAAPNTNSSNLSTSKMEVTPNTVPEVLPSTSKDTNTTPPKEKKPQGVKRQRKDLETKDDNGATEISEKNETTTTVHNYLIVAKSVRTFLKSLPTACHCGADALPTLNTKVTELLIEASARAHANGRKTIKQSDF